MFAGVVRCVGELSDVSGSCQMCREFSDVSGSCQMCRGVVRVKKQLTETSDGESSLSCQRCRRCGEGDKDILKTSDMGQECVVT